jgi:hypothetical protein
MRGPVWYHPSVGPEPSLIAERSGLCADEVIQQHSDREYQVFALGFALGFAFMGLGVSAQATPRRPIVLLNDRQTLGAICIWEHSPLKRWHGLTNACLSPS